MDPNMLKALLMGGGMGGQPQQPQVNPEEEQKKKMLMMLLQQMQQGGGMGGQPQGAPMQMGGGIGGALPAMGMMAQAPEPVMSPEEQAQWEQFKKQHIKGGAPAPAPAAPAPEPKPGGGWLDMFRQKLDPERRMPESEKMKSGGMGQLMKLALLKKMLGGGGGMG